MQNTYSHFLHIAHQRPNLVLGILLQTQGSVPQVPGACALFENDELLTGTLGGGVLEAEAQALAPAVSLARISRIKTLHFNASVTDSGGAICGGTATFLLDADPHKSRQVFQAMQRSMDHQKNGVLISVIHLLDNDTCDIQRTWLEAAAGNQAFLNYGVDEAQINQAIQTHQALFIDQKNTKVFIEPICPRPQLIIVGAGHIGQALNQLAHSLDFDTTVLDNRAELLTEARFPNARLLKAASITTGFEQLTLTATSYIVITTQGHHADAEALKCCIHSNAAYIGMIGSRRKTALMRQNFIDQDWATSTDLDRVFAPIGLDIGSQTVPEIALSIAAQLVQIRRQQQQPVKPPQVGCLILAAGMSTRMKQQKLIMPYGSQSFVESIVEKAMASLAQKTLMVVGSDQKAVMAKVAHLQPALVYNRRYPEGMLSSVQCGVLALGDCEAIVILLGDQPMVTTATIDALISAWIKSKKGLVVPTFKGKRGHPVLIDMKYKQLIQKLNGNIGLKELFQKQKDDILEIEINSDDILKDIDTPEDYERTTI